MDEAASLPPLAGHGRDMLIATFSGRSLAASARRAGFVPLVADLFADNDLRELAERFEIVHGDFVDGFDGGELLAALERLAEGRRPAGIVCGPGFEDRPELLDAIAARWPLIGNGGTTMRALKDPVRFAGLCKEAGIAHPEISLERPVNPQGWLSKRIGAAGGLHIGYAADVPHAGNRYYQRIREGERISALFVAATGEARILGFSRQWPAPGPGEPFRYGGACGPIRPAPEHEPAMTAAVQAIAARTGLKGLGSADFLAQAGEAPVLLEINPRPGAALDVFDRNGVSLFGLHVAASEGRLPDRPLSPSGARASGYAYLDAEEIVVRREEWPGWITDRPAAGTILRHGDPICTLHADADDPNMAMALYEERLAAIKQEMEEQAE